MSASVSGTEASVQVVVRIRPPLSHDGQSGCAEVLNGQVVRLKDNSGVSRDFSFDVAFGADRSQEDVWREANVTQLVQKVCVGFNGTIFAYGQTGSGKTYTMDGFVYKVDASGNAQIYDPPDPSHLGLVPRCIHMIYEQLAEQEGDYTVTISFLQIYNERVYDLLNPVHHTDSNNKGLRVRWDPGQSFFVENLFEYECHSAEEMMEYVRMGARNKVVASHRMNQASSRAHSLCTITVKSHVPGESEVLWSSKLALVDLAGSERVDSIEVTGRCFQESISINTSLFVLRKVVRRLSKPEEGSHIPFRESKLTSLLKDSLGGNSFTLMVSCLSSSNAQYDDHLSTLQYATQARAIRNKPKVNLDPKLALIEDLKSEVSRLELQLGIATTYIVDTLKAELPSNLRMKPGPSPLFSEEVDTKPARWIQSQLEGDGSHPRSRRGSIRKTEETSERAYCTGDCTAAAQFKGAVELLRNALAKVSELTTANGVISKHSADVLDEHRRVLKERNRLKDESEMYKALLNGAPGDTKDSIVAEVLLLRKENRKLQEKLSKQIAGDT